MGPGVLIHLIVSTCTAIILGLVSGRINAIIAVTSLTAGALAGVWVWWRLRNEERLFPDITFIETLFYGCIIVAGLQHFLYLLYYDQNVIKTLHVNNFGDLTMHIQYLRSIANGAYFWPANPEFAGDLLRYPLGMDLYNALWEVLGVPTDSHLFFIGIVMTVVTVSLLHQWMGWLGVGAFFLNGGLANWRFLWEKRLYDYQNALAWKNFFLSLWITQRGFLFAIPAGIYVVKMITEVLLKERTLNRTEKVICATLWSSLALFHLHTFFIISLTLGICILIYKQFRPLLPILLPVFVTGSFFVWFSTNGFSGLKVLHIQWGWLAGKENLFEFWTINLGPWILLAAAGYFFTLKKSFADIRPMAIVFATLFIVLTCVMVAPWDWDNIKVLVWLYLFIVWLAWRTWVRHLSPLAALLTGFILFFSGTISVVSSLPAHKNGVELYKADELWEAKAALLNLDSDSVLAVAPDPNHPAMFLGAKVAMGYPGHLWSHGIDYAARENALSRIFKGEGDWLAEAQRMGITHIYWGENEKRKYNAVNPSWLYQFKDISRSRHIRVFELQSTGPTTAIH